MVNIGVNGGCIGFYGVYRVFLGFCRVLQGFIGLCIVGLLSLFFLGSPCRFVDRCGVRHASEGKAVQDALNPKP